MEEGRTGQRLRWLVLPAAALVLAACGGGGGDATQADAASLQDTRQAPAVRPALPANTAGRLLATNCFQCHGTGGVGGFDSIRGREASEVVEFLEKPAASDIMATHAQGYTRAQLDAIVGYLQQP